MLIIFDLDNTCIYASDTPAKNTFRVDNYYVRIRPGFYQLREWLYVNGYEIAVWSAGVESYVTRIAKYLFPRLKWIRHRSHCETEFHVKNLTTVKEPEFLLIDDNFVHLLHNEFDDRIYHIPAWNGNRADREFFVLRSKLLRLGR